MFATCFSLVLLAVQAEQNAKPELLQGAPRGWRFERIDFPLPFAKDVASRGFEELRFAPGMYDAKSETYFTYVFAMKIEDEATVDAAYLDTMLERYYRGLCAAVAKDKDFEIDAKKISAEVAEEHFEAPRSRHFRAKLQSYDPFVTGKPLTLHLEILVVQQSPSDHRLFAAVAPKPTDDPIWRRLRALKKVFHASQLRAEP